MKIFSFEKLNVWQKSRQLSMVIYNTTKDFPDDEKYGLTSQMCRAAISISSKIAEGSGRYNPKDKARFTEIAFGSELELLNQVVISTDLEYFQEVDYLNKGKNYLKLWLCLMHCESLNLINYKNPRAKCISF